MNNDRIINFIVTSFYENKNSHAFLVSTNNMEKAVYDIKRIVKKINCIGDKSDNCTCNICKMIETENCPDFIIVRPDGKEIRKDQIVNVMDAFSTSAFIAKYSVYLITDSDKMNVSAANKILKFLEEPEDNIIGFFLTSNISQILPTIKSRCEVFNFYYGYNDIADAFGLSGSDCDKYYPIAIDLLKKIDTEKDYVLMSLSKQYAKYDRNELDLLFDLIYKMYSFKFESIVNKEYNNDEIIGNIINNIDCSDLNVIVNRMKKIEKIILTMKGNVNKELILNRLFLEWE